MSDNELKQQLQAIREDVEDAFETFMQVYEANAATFDSIAHELRVRGHRVKAIGPNWLARAVHYGRFAEKKRYPVR